VTGDGRWRVPVLPPGVTIGTVVYEAGTLVVMVPPFEVRTDETVADGATGRVEVPPLEVMTVVVLTDSIEAVWMIELTATGTVTTEPSLVVIS
jgi:hypothetical protein